MQVHVSGLGTGGGGCLALKMYFEIFILGLSMKYVQLSLALKMYFEIFILGLSMKYVQLIVMQF